MTKTHFDSSFKQQVGVAIFDFAINTNQKGLEYGG